MLVCRPILYASSRVGRNEFTFRLGTSSISLFTFFFVGQFLVSPVYRRWAVYTLPPINDFPSDSPALFGGSLRVKDDCTVVVFALYFFYIQLR